MKKIDALTASKLLKIVDGIFSIKEGRTGKTTLIQEEYILNEDLSLGTSTIYLDPEEYFTLGDNRQISIDSRVLGPVNDWNLEGRVFLGVRFNPFPKIRIY